MMSSYSERIVSMGFETEVKQRIVSSRAYVFLFAALVIAVPTVFMVGFLGVVVALTPDVVFGADRAGTPLILLALGIGGVLEVGTLILGSRFLARFKLSGS